MSLGLETEPLLSDLFVGAILILSIGLSVEVARLLSMKRPNRRAIIYISVGIILSFLWWFTFDKKYFPTTEVNTAVIPALAHPYEAVWAAPYGILWYWLNQGVLYTVLTITNSLFTDNLGLGWMAGLAAVNLFFFWFLQDSELLTPYFMTSLFLWAVVPWDLSILWIVLLGLGFQRGLVRLGFVGLGVIAKMPFGAPLSVWKYDFLNGQEGGTVGSAFVPGHMMPYLVLAAWSIAVLLKPYIRFLSLTSYIDRTGLGKEEKKLLGPVEKPRP